MNYESEYINKYIDIYMLIYELYFILWVQEGLPVGSPAVWYRNTLPQQPILCHVSHVVPMSAAACQTRVICTSVAADSTINWDKTRC